MEHSSETLVIPKTEVDNNIEILPQIELDTETDVRFKNMSELVLKNTALLIQPKLEFPPQIEIDPMLTPKLEPDVEVPYSVEHLLEPKSEPHVELNSEPYVEPNSEPHVEPNSEPHVDHKFESVSENAALDIPLVEPTSIAAQDEESNATYEYEYYDSDELPDLSYDGEDTSASDQLTNVSVDGEETSGRHSQAPVAEDMETTSTTLLTEAISPPPPQPPSPSPPPPPLPLPVTIAEEIPSTTAAADATAAATVAEVVDVESGWPPQVVDLTEEEGPVDTDIVEVLQVEQNVIYDGSVTRREERKWRRRRKRERREQRASNSNSDFAQNNEPIEINDVESDVEDDGASTSGLSAPAVPPVTVDLAFTVPDSSPDRLSPPPLRQVQNANYDDIPFMNNAAQNQNMEIDFQDPNLLFGNLLGSPVLENVDDGIPFLRPNSPDVFPMAQMGEQHPDQVMRPPSPELFNLIPMERPPIRRTRMTTRNAAAAAAADRDRSRSPLRGGGGGGDGGAAAAAAAAADYAAFERLLAPLDYGPPPAGPPRRLMGVPDNNNMDMHHLHMHLPPQPQPQPHTFQHQIAAPAPIPPRQPSPPPRAGSLSCPICLDTLGSIQAQRRNLVSTVCGHVFCSHCLEESLKARKECPTCRKKLTKKQYHPIYI